MGSVKILKASAGSGKTFMLAYEYVKSVIAEYWNYKHILAVTFTNKATEEMKQRIISELNALANGQSTLYLEMLERDLEINRRVIKERALTARGKILHDYSHFSILTIDKFFQRIIRSFVRELGIDVNFNLELKTDTILSSAVDAIIEDITVDEKLKRWIVDFAEEKIQNSKRWNIKNELTALGGEIFKEGYKTIDKTHHSREEIEKVVFTSKRKANEIKKELKEVADSALKLLDDNNLSVKDFAYGANSFANYFNKISKGDFSPYTKRVEDALVSSSKWYTKSSKRVADIEAVAPQLMAYLEQLCSLYSNNIVYINSVDLIMENYRNLALLNDLALKIQEQCSASNIMPISATNDILRELIAGNETPFIFEKVGTHFTQFMIDEFQDTSAMQWCNFIPLLSNALAQSETNPVLLVGDIKQSIYRWRGGDWQILATQIDEQLGDTETINLNSNYRSCKNIVNFNNNLIESCVVGDNAELNSALIEAKSVKAIGSECCERYTDMLVNAYRDHKQFAKTDGFEGYVNITKYGELEEFVPPVVKRVEELQERGYMPKDIAILVRGNMEGASVAKMLLDHKSVNPNSKYCYDVMTQEALMIGSSTIAQFIVSTLYLAVNDKSSIRLAIYNRFLNRGYVETLNDEDRTFLQSIRLLAPLEAFEEIVIHYELADRVDEIAYVQALHEQVIKFSSNTIADIQLFIKWWETSGKKESISMPKNSNAITIITIHKSKGMEYKCVIIPFCIWNLNPKTGSIVWSSSNNSQLSGISSIPLTYKKSIAESYFAEDYFKELVLSHIDNINILYVATTRAREELHIMIADKDRVTLSVSKLIEQSIRVDGDVCSIGDLKGVFDPVRNIYEFGTPNNDPISNEVDIHSRSHYVTNSPNQKVKLRLPSQKYYEDSEGNIELSPRNYGILMHKVFENACNKEDIQLSILDLYSSSIISEKEMEHLNNIVARSFVNPIVARWFSDQWDEVKNEQEIIMPLGDGMKRPDRVMIAGDCVEIVDYKFGLERRDKYTYQMLTYKEILTQMGYEKIKGYVWYISLDDIVEV